MKKSFCMLFLVLFIMFSALAVNAASGDVLVMEGDICVGQYDTVSAALDSLGTNQYLKLSGDVQESVTIPAGVLVDLCGNTLSGVTVKEGALFMDTATDGYSSENAGRLIPVSGTPAANVKTTAEQVGAIKRYLTVCDDSGYSFHRFYMAITKVSVNPGSVGVGYKARFVGSEAARQSLSSGMAYGYSLWLEGSSKVVRGHSAAKFGGDQELTLRINKFLTDGNAQNAQRAQTPLYASVYLRLRDGTMIETAPVRYTFKEILELANEAYSSFSETQKNGLNTLSDRFSDVLLGYDISNFHHTGDWVGKTGSQLLTMLKSSVSIPEGSYYLTEDVNLGSKYIRVEKGRTVNICLNGHTLHSNTRLLRVYQGTLNICDCHTGEHEGTLQSSFTYDSDLTDAGEYAPIMYTYAGSTINFYGGNMKAVNPVSFAGLIALSHDNSDKTLPASVFNMYGGTMYGNTVDGASANNKSGTGGAIAVWNGATFNMYGGTIYGGTAHYGAALYTPHSACTINIYDGTITGGQAVKRIKEDGTTAMSKGGNIYSVGSVNIYGGTIEGGSVTEGQGGNIYSSGPVQIYGGTITGGSATVYTNESGVTTYNSGKGGGVYISASTLFVGGETVIYGNSDCNIYLSPASSVNIEKLTGSAKIGMYPETAGAVSRDMSTAAHLVSEREGYSFYAVNDCVMLSAEQPQSFEKTVSQFSVGYGLVDITPTEIGLTMSGWGNPNGRKTDGSVGFPLMITTIAITDEQNNTILMITVDLQSVSDAYADEFTKRISAATGVPVDQIYITATHTHNCPSLSVSNPGNARYHAMVGTAMQTSAVNALADRSPATMKTGQFETEGLNFTRNYYYYLNDDTTTERIYYGDQYGPRPANGEKVYRVREGDHTMHLIEFTRTGKQPVLMVNWRAHPHRSGGMWKYSSDSDVVGATRAYFHENTDYLFAYYQGASGNMNTFSKISGETYKSGKIKEFGIEMGRQITKNGLPNLKSAETGLIQTASYTYAAPVNHDDDCYYENAQRLLDYFSANPDLMDTYNEQIAEANSLNPDGTPKYEGVYTVYHAKQIVARHELGETRDIRINAFSIGKSVGFCTSAGEIWDRVSEELELERSPFPETWFIGYCDGSAGYIPYGVAGNYPSYEYYSCVFKQDDAILQVMDYLEGFLKKQWANAQ